MKNIFKISFLTLAVTIMGACNDFDLEKGLDNPNEVNVANLDVNLLMNKIQAEFGDTFAELTDKGMEVSRMTAMGGEARGETYERAYLPQDLDQIWENAYQRTLIQIETLLSKAETEGFTAHAGAAKVMKAFTIVSLVDFFGDIPYSKALKGSSLEFNPGVDGGKAVYDAAFTLLDAAIADLAKTPKGGLTRDIFYGGDVKKWTALANTIKLKMYLNLRLTDAANAKAKITELLGKDLIDTDAEEFTYKYSSANNPARARSPLYRQMYAPQAGAASGYLSNYFMLISYKQKGVEDPRWRYYVYRQVGSIAQALKDDPKSIPCIISPRPDHYTRDQAWCAFDPGFYGRDHGNADGIPPDARAITCFGVYPAGGRLDTNNGDANYQVVTQQGQGADGAGIEPIWMSSFTDFVKAEAALTLGTPGDAAALLQSGVKKSIERVRAFAAAKGQSLPAGLEASQTAYLAKVDELYKKATTDADRLDILVKEYFISLYGNGVEAYNMYRRTGKPSDIQPIRSPSGGLFYRTFVYPSVFVNLNSATPQKATNAVKVFWDNNPDGFIK